MSEDREPFSWIEIDIDGCDLTFGIGACTAALGVNGVTRKCFGPIATCRSTKDFVHKKVWRTLRYCQPRSNLPKGMTFFPVMDGYPTEVSATVNIAGSDDEMSAFGRRATISTPLLDFPYHDRLTDPYAAERVSGDAQIDEPGYPPELRGTHFGKMKTRWPYYAGRPYRRCDGYLVGGEIVDVTTRHYVITNISGPGDDGKVKIDGSDILDLADDKQVQIPPPSKGVLKAEITDTSMTFTLAPDGIGEKDYAPSGRLRIGSEMMDFTRVADVVTITARGASKTASAKHALGDTVQEVLSFKSTRLDDAVFAILRKAGIPDAQLNVAGAAAEVDRWLPSHRVTRDVGEPTGAKALISTMVPLGFSIFWESETPMVEFKANRPVDGDQIWDLSDLNTNLDVSIRDDDKKRATDVLFWTVIKDGTKSATSKENYARVWSASDLEAREPARYGKGEIKSYLCPWLGDGADAIVRVASARLLKRFNTTPKFATIELDAKFKGIRLTDVVRLTTSGLQDDTGKPETGLYQVIQRSEPIPGERIEIVVQSYQFQGRFSFATANDAPFYQDATPAQRDPGMFACDPVTLKMPNGDAPYEAI